MSRLNHLSTFRDCRRGDTVKQDKTRRIRCAGRHLYYVHKSGRREPMRFVFALGSYILDIRDLAHVYAPELLPHMNDYTGEISPIVLRAVLAAAEQHLRFPRKPEIYSIAA